MIKRLHHAQMTIPTDGEREARAFYGSFLGLTELAKPASLEGRGGLWFEVGDMQLHLGVQDQIDRKGSKTHVAFEVQDLAQVLDLLTSRGCEILPGAEIPGMKRFETRDPFGNRLEFFQRQAIDHRLAALKPKDRFTSRVSDYVKYRPSYPSTLIAALKESMRLGPKTTVADFGSGTGIFSALLLGTGATVLGIEPNDGMRAAAEQQLGSEANFRSIRGSAEASGLPDHSVDVVTAAQAFHWFDVPNAKREFARILRPGGQIALVWNERRASGSHFAEAYDALISRYWLDGAILTAHNANHSDSVAELFDPAGYVLERFINRQDVDFDGLAGRLISSSYIPKADHPAFEPMMAELKVLFDRSQQQGKVSIDYDTRLYRTWKRP